MTDPELIRRAEAAGITTRYENWQRQLVEVPPDTLQAILAALASPAPPHPSANGGAGAAGVAEWIAEDDGPASGGGVDGGRPADDGPGSDGGVGEAGRVGVGRGAADNGGGKSGEDSGRSREAGTAGDVAPEVDGRAWGFTVQLYSVRSRGSWGHGDLRDLAELAAWSGRELGAGFVLVNPLHAAEPVPPVSPSPYLPMTRRYASPLYLRIEDIPEYARLREGERQRIQDLAGPLRARNSSAELIDRDAVWAAKRAALELIYRVPLTPARHAEFDAYRMREGAELRYWASWCALAERHGADWRDWPAELRDREAGVAAAAAGALSGAAGFHAWLQWLIDEQLAAAQGAAVAAGMAHGIIHDLAVGVHPGGADAWAHQDLLVGGMSVGAPPDSFNQLGQNWAQPPWHPQRLAAASYRPLAGLFAAVLRHAGGLRVDHVMGLTRLWWVPDGMSADRGAYVRYDQAAAVGALAGQAARAGALAIGEDLGTVEESTRTYLAEHAVLGTMMLWFAQEPDGSPLLAQHWRRDCMATVGTHDVPTIAGFATGDQVTERSRLGLLAAPEEEERRSATMLVAGWRELLTAEGLLTPDRQPAEAAGAAERAGVAGKAEAGARAPGREAAGAAGQAGPGPSGREQAGSAEPTEPTEPTGAAGVARPAAAGESGEARLAELTVAMYGFLARTPAVLIGVSLADAVGERRSQNIPGTSDEYPNWRIPLCDAAGKPVLIEELPALPLVQAAARAANPVR
jgi:4-alpha-glucanotransferase